MLTRNLQACEKEEGALGNCRLPRKMPSSDCLQNLHVPEQLPRHVLVCESEAIFLNIAVVWRLNTKCSHSFGCTSRFFPMNYFVIELLSYTYRSQKLYVQNLRNPRTYTAPTCWYVYVHVLTCWQRSSAIRPEVACFGRRNYLNLFYTLLNCAQQLNRLHPSCWHRELIILLPTLRVACVHHS